MSKPLRVLIVEDSEPDALLLLRELRSGGYDPTYQRVASAEGMASALKSRTWDVVISDHSMPQFSAPAALALLKGTDIDIPFIIVSGAIGEELAVEAMKAGAHDFLAKDRLMRLVPAVERELTEAEVRRGKRAAEAALRKLNAELEQRVAERTADLEKANARLAAIGQVTDVALAQLSLNDMLVELLVRVRKVLGTDTATILLLSEDGERLLVRASSGLEEEVEQEIWIPVGRGVAGKIASTRATLVVEDLSATQVVSPVLKERLRSLIGAPLYVGDRVIGVLHAGTKETRRFTADDLRLIEVVADRAASTIERTRAEEERDRLLAEVSAIFTSLADPILVFDAGGRPIRANPATRATYGADPVDDGVAQFIQRANIRYPDGRLLSGENMPALRALRERKVLGDRLFTTNARGEEVVVQIAASPLIVNGELKGAVSLWHDISERERLLEEVREANSRLVTEGIRSRELAEEAQHQAAELEATIDSIQDGVVIYDADGHIAHMNQTAQRILGYSAQEVPAPLEERIARLRVETPEGKPFPAEEVPAVRALKGETSSGAIMIWHLRGGETIWVSVSAAPIRSAEGSFLGAITTFTDITELHELQEQQADLVRMISHDLRSPLTYVQGQAQMLLRNLERGVIDAERLKRSASSINVGAKRMDALIQDLVDMARVESGQLEIARTQVDFGAFAGDLVQRLRGVVDTSRIQLRLPPDLPAVQADPNRLERVLTNLLSNALKYSEAPAEVVLSAERTGKEVTLSMADRGVGISPEDLAHIFDRYYRVKSTSKQEGLGLGLYITKMLIEAMGGRIWVESTPGEGSTFRFTLPVASEAPDSGTDVSGQDSAEGEIQ